MSRRVPTVIAFTGYAGSGKSEAAKRLVDAHGYRRERFAGPLKDMIRALGLGDREIEGDLKEAPCDLLCGKTPREAMQRLGAEWGRDLIHPDIWAVAWMRRAELAIEGGSGVVCEDCRYPNEVEAVHELGGLVVRVARPGVERKSSHSSESFSFDVDAEIANDGSIEDLHRRVDELIGFVS